MICILGGGGCFGLNLARYLTSKGIPCFGIGRSIRKDSAFWLAPPGYKYHRAHVVDDLDKTCNLILDRHPDAIVNFAAQGEGAASYGDNSPDYYRTNTWGMVQLITRLFQRVNHFVHIGTSEVYGSVTLPAKETAPVTPSSPYAISKLAFEQHLQLMSRYHAFPMNIIRPSNCYTSGQQLYRIIPKTIVSALTRSTLTLHNGGRQEKSYLHATDLSRAILEVIEHGRKGEIYNVGPAGPISIKLLVDSVSRMCEVEPTEFVKEGPDRIGQDSRYWLDSSKIAQDTGWTQTIGLQRGLREMVDWVREFPQLLSMERNYVHVR